MRKLEFVGGPVDGEVRRVPEGSSNYFIPIPVEMPFPTMHTDETEPEMMTSYVHVYKIGRKLVAIPGQTTPEVAPVMVYDGQVKR